MRTELIGPIGDLVPQLAAYKLPRAIAFVPELPQTASGKVQRFLLRGPA